MHMKRPLVIVLSLLLTASATVAVQLIVTKKGEAIWARKPRRQGDAITFVNKESGQEETRLVADLSGVISIVRRGKRYEPAQIQRNIDRIKKVMLRHFKHKRLLSPILREWELLQRPSPELEEKISGFQQAFADSTKETRMFEKAVFGLGMLKYKDVHGKYTERIDILVDEITADYLETNLARLRELVKKKDLAVGDFVAVRKLGKALLASATDDRRKEEIEKLVADSRNRAYEFGMRDAVVSFKSGGKGIDAYLRAARILMGVKDEVAETEAQKADVDAKMENLVARVSQTQPAYSFEYKGYPLTRDDMSLYRRTEKASSRYKLGSVAVDEQCLIIARRVPALLRVGTPFSLPLRFVFNREQPEDRIFGITIRIMGERGLHTHTTRLRTPEIRTGHADVTLEEDFSLLEPGFTLRTDTSRHPRLYAYLSYLPAPEENPDDWHAISVACGWLIQ